MRISRLAIRNLRVHRDTEIDLVPGLTIVRGPNEAGKSTLQRALELALYRRATSAGAEIDGLRTWGAGEDERPTIEVDFTQEYDDGVRQGHIRKEFRGARGQVHLEIDGDVITDPARADEVLAELTGIPSEKFFRSTASIRHHEVNDLARDEGALRDRLQASISGADRGTSLVKRRLERALRELAAKGDKNPGRLRVAEQAVSSAQASVTAGETLLRKLEDDRDALGLAHQRRGEAEATLLESRSLLDRARQAERLAADREIARERFERHRQAVAVSEQIATLEGGHPAPVALRVLRPAVEHLRILDREVAEARAQIGQDPVSVDYEIKPPSTAWRLPAFLAIFLTLAGLVAGIGGVALDTLPVSIGGIVAVVVAFLFALFARGRRKALQDIKRAHQMRDDEITRRLRGRTQLEDDLRAREEARAKVLRDLGQADLAAAEDILRREDEHVGTIDRARAQLEGLVGRVPPETLPMLRDAAALEVEQKGGALEALGPIAKEPRARERLEVEVREAEEAVEKARDQEAGARARVEQNPVDAEQVAGEVERLARWRDQLGALQRRGRIYQLALDAIVEAEVSTMRTATHYLEKRMRTDLDRLTGGRYRRVRVDHATLDISVHAPERGGWVRVEELSQGTLDLAYLAARLGLVRLVTHDRRPPLLFDDPFVTFDDARATRAFTVLRELAHDFQVIYLTTSDRYDAAADAVVVLPGPTALDDPSLADERDDDRADERGQPRPGDPGDAARRAGSAGAADTATGRASAAAGPASAAAGPASAAAGPASAAAGPTSAAAGPTSAASGPAEAPAAG